MARSYCGVMIADPGPRHDERLRHLVDEMDTRLRRDGQRSTTGRRALLETLATADRPLSIPELLTACPGLSQSSAYRNLDVLEHAGIVRRLVQPNADHARFELDEEFTTHHHHLICRRCGAITDVTLAPQVEHRIEDALAAAARAEGFTAERHTVDLIGLCHACS